MRARSGSTGRSTWWRGASSSSRRRAARALATAYAALKPGGLIVAPLLGDEDAAAAEPHGTEARSLAVSRVVHGGWGVPSRSASDLVDEMTAAGFVDAAVTPAAESPLRIVHATRP